MENVEITKIIFEAKNGERASIRIKNGKILISSDLEQILEYDLMDGSDRRGLRITLGGISSFIEENEEDNQ